MASPSKKPVAKDSAKPTTEPPTLFAIFRNILYYLLTLRGESKPCTTSVLRCHAVDSTTCLTWPSPRRIGQAHCKMESFDWIKSPTFSKRNSPWAPLLPKPHMEYTRPVAKDPVSRLQGQQLLYQRCSHVPEPWRSSHCYAIVSRIAWYDWLPHVFFSTSPWMPRGLSCSSLDAGKAKSQFRESTSWLFHGVPWRVMFRKGSGLNVLIWQTREGSEACTSRTAGLYQWHILNMTS